MTRRQMMIIARGAANLAVNCTDPADRLVDDRLEYYKEYMDQLETEDDDCLKGWIGSLIEGGARRLLRSKRCGLKPVWQHRREVKTMNKAQEDLKAILDRLAEWRQENGFGYVEMNIDEDGRGHAYTFDITDKDIDIGIFQYSPWNRDAETPAAGTAGESKKN